MKIYIFIFLFLLMYIQSNSLLANNTCMNFQECLVLAEKGDTYAQVIVADDLSIGANGVEKNLKLAFFWYQKAAQKGSVRAPFAVAAMLDNGDGVEKNSISAFTWYYIAAVNGHEVAQEMLGDYFYDGNEIPQDDVEAYSWYYTALKNGNLQVQNVFDELKKYLEQDGRLAQATQRAEIYYELYKK